MSEIEIVSFAILIFSIIIHEVAHGLTALWQGDHTAENAGRITLNPIPHIDLLGSIVIPGLLILTNAGIILGWAKPVPINPNNFKNQKWGEFWVSLAGPLSNFILAILFLLPLTLLNPIPESWGQIFTYGVLINLILGIFNLFPIPPLDGSKILYSLLPYKISSKVKNFMEANQIIIFILFIIIISKFPVIETILKWFIN